MTGLAWAPGLRRGVRRGSYGFSMMELLVTIVLAGIIFAAMVPVFVNAMKATSSDKVRIGATNVTQGMIEAINLKGANGDYDLIDGPYLDSSLGTSDVVNGRTYTIAYVVDPQTHAKTVTVTVSWGQGATALSMSQQTILMNPQPIVHTSGSSTPVPTPSPSSTTGYYTLTVGVNAPNCTSAGVTVTRTDVVPNVLQVPNVQIPTSANGLQVAWTGLVGGPDVVYHVVVHYTHNGSPATRYTDVTLSEDKPVFFDVIN